MWETIKYGRARINGQLIAWEMLQGNDCHGKTWYTVHACEVGPMDDSEHREGQYSRKAAMEIWREAMRYLVP